MINRKLKNRLLHACLPIVLLTFVSVRCTEDPDVVNEEELITTVTLTLEKTSTDPAPFMVNWHDANLNSIADEGEVTYTNVLLEDQTYTAIISVSNETIDISKEIRREAKDHIVCFEVTTADIAISGFDTDSNGQRLGLTSTWTTGDASLGTVNIKLRHQPGFKTGDCPLPGDPAPGQTDFDITLSLEVAGSL